MKLLELTRPTTEENLAVDEVLLDSCEQADEPREVLRLWENPSPAIILGRSSRVDEEVNRDWCNARGIRYYRRSSGGASVVIGPGCLMYAVVLDYRHHPELRMLDQAHQYVMQRLVAGLRRLDLAVEFQGTCDVTLNNLKFSGNSLRCRRNCFLYHGTLLYDFPLSMIQDSLGTPPRQPDYREGRSHGQFVTNLPVARGDLIQAIREAWNVEEGPDASSDGELIDESAVRKLVQEKFANPAWNDKR